MFIVEKILKAGANVVAANAYWILLLGSMGTGLLGILGVDKFKKYPLVGTTLYALIQAIIGVL